MMCGSPSHYIAVFFSIFSAVISQSVIAADADNNINLCPVEETSAAKHSMPRAFSRENINNTDISADFTESSSDGSTSLKGNLIIERHLLRITADQAHYNKQENTLKFSGNVHIDTEALSLDADAGTVSMGESNGQDKQQGEFTNIKFFIPESNMKGSAEIILSGDDNQSILKSANITSCDLLDPDWLISADEIRLDHNDEYGSAEDVVVRFKGVPFLYTPYIEFPTSDKRRSGLLFPEVGASSSSGIELAVPWYWNIAPNQDAVITPRYLEKRGLQLGGDYRYLTKSTKGELQGTYLPDDNVTQEDRFEVLYRQQSLILPNLSFDVNLHDISDSQYFNDFSSTLESTSQTHLNRYATLRYNLKNWHMKALVQDIKTIDTTTEISTRPYSRLPQLTFDGDTKVANTPLQFTLDSEYVDFAHEDNNKITGGRFTIKPGLELPLSGAAWFFKPAVKFSHTQYDVGTQGGETIPGTTQEVENRNLPISSIDTGLFFERDFGDSFLQTLEPRLYYLNVPFEDQSNTPLFDTTIPDFSVAQLFRDNRFVGGDRVGDANQLTLAITSRILNPDTGDELVRASIGQIYYFEDRKVTLDGTIDTAKQSDIIAELDTNWGHWRSNIDIQWDINNDALSKENYFLHYKSDARHLFNIGYRKRLKDNMDDIEQTDTSFVYAFNRNYSGFARWNYSLKDDKNIDTIGGIAYNGCCWSLQLLMQRRLQNSTTVDDAYDNSILVQFVFKGLGSLSGSKARTTLEQSIFGYTDIFQ